jgi:DNA-dependent RNA polymerase
MDLYENFYTIKLHKALWEGSYKSDCGVYLVVFRLLNKDSNILVYNYVYYPDIFINSVLYYIIRKNLFKSSMVFREWGDFLAILDNRLGDGDSIDNLKDQIRKFDFLAYERTDVDVKSYIGIFDLIKKMTVLDGKDNIDNMVSLIDWAANKNYMNFFQWIISDFDLYKNEIESKDVYILKDCLFVVKNLEELTSKLSEKGFVVNRGPKSQRDQLNSMSSFLSLVDLSIRNNIYTQQIHCVKQGAIPSNWLLPKSKFSFRNIHMNIGNVKYYSTERYITSKAVDNRQKLFESNYTLISDILEKNYNVGSYKVQEEIEKCLFNQENFFSKLNDNNFRLNFNDESYNFIFSKQEELCNLLNYPDELVVNTKIYSGKYIPLVKDIVSILGSRLVTDLLLSYYLQILTKETHNIDGSEIQTPGIMSTKAFNDFGKKIYNKYIYMLYIKTEKYKNNKNYSLSEYIESIYSKYEEIYEVDGSYAMLGGYFVWNLVTTNLLTQVLAKHPENSKETVNYLRIPQNVRELLVKNNIRIYHLPQKLPMVCEPKDWIYSLDNSKNKLGGFLLNDKYYNEKLIRDKIGYEKSTTLKEGNLVIPMVTGVMKTPYKINVDTLEFIFKYGIRKNIIIDDSSKEIKEYISNPYKKNRLTKVALKYRSLISKIIMEKNILSIAEVYSKVDKIYFPVRLDFRLRVYCDTEYFDYQKSDLAKGLISFAKPGILTKTDVEGIKYYKAYGANMYGHGLDKKSLNHRVKWVEENTDRILNFEYNDIVDNAENKSCFISFCFEYINFVKFVNSIDEFIFHTYLPIQLDATCNGYQHLALLTKETDLLSELNLDPSTHDDDPGDFYSYISDMCKEYVQSYINKFSASECKTEKDISKINSLNKILGVKFGRDIYKLIIMRDSYSAGIPKITESILSNENMIEQGKGRNTHYLYKDFKIKLDRKDIMIFVGCVKSVITTIAPKIKNLSKYLTKIVNICTILSMPIPWTLPSGAEINESYLIEKEKKIPAFAFTKSKYTFKKYLPGKYDVKKQKRAIRPNLIHSLDACVISELYANLKNYDVDLYTVHDCFAVTANNVHRLINKLKMVYIKLYSSNDYLTVFDTMLKININNTFGDKVYKLNDDYINLPNKSKFKTTPFPDINEIIRLDKSKLGKVAFPDITSITKLNKNINIDQLKEASYPVI